MRFKSFTRAENFKAQYFLVYGTLRPGLGNWQWSFQHYGNHVGTFEMKGFRKDDGISCEWTGKSEHTTVMDLFKVPEEFIDTMNIEVDSLEGSTGNDPASWWYVPGVVTFIDENGEEIRAKFYESNPYEKDHLNSDYLIESRYSGVHKFEDAIQLYESLGYTKGVEFYTQKLKEQKDVTVRS